MDDSRIIDFERSLWIGEGEVYRERLSPDCVTVVPEQPFLLRGEEAIEAVEATPRWSDVEISDLAANRAQEGLIVVGYHVDASRGEQRFTAFWTSTYQQSPEGDWHVIQHQQTLPAKGIATAGEETERG